MVEMGSTMTLLRSWWSRTSEDMGIGLGGLAILQAVSRRPEIRATEIGNLLKIDKAVVSRKITHMREMGLIEANPSPEDGRVFLLTMTKKGETEMDRVREMVAEFYSEKLADWTSEETEILRSLLHRFNTTAFQ